MAWSFTSDRPVYLQVAERIRLSVLIGEFIPGEQIPSVRQLALTAAVNPNTIQHAFTELESEGLIESRGTTGRFVTEDLEIIERCRSQQAKELIGSFVQKADALGIDQSTLINMIKEEFNERS